VTALAPPAAVPRFLPLFAIALAVRFAVVALGVLLIAAQPTKPVKVVGLAVAGFPADLRPPKEKDPVAENFRDEIRAGSAHTIEPWYRWDAVWLANVAKHGYAGAADKGGRLGVAFMPAQPACMAAASALGLNPFWIGLLAANIAAAAGTAVLARVATRLTNDRDTGLRTFVLLLAFPAAFFFSAPYNEGFGLLFTALALSAWLDRKTYRAALFAALGSLARMTGVAVGVAALVGWLCDDRTRPGLKRAIVVAVGSFAGLILFWGFLAWVVDDPLAGLKSQVAWGRRGLSVWNPWYAIESIYDPELPHWGEAFVVLVFAILGIRAWARRGAFWGVLTLVPVAQMMLSGTFLSAHRLILAALPGFIELADVLKNRAAFRVTVIACVLVQLVLLNRYVHWMFAG
jgi:hypothetical protein